MRLEASASLELQPEARTVPQVEEAASSKLLVQLAESLEMRLELQQGVQLAVRQASAEAPPASSLPLQVLLWEEVSGLWFEEVEEQK